VEVRRKLPDLLRALGSRGPAEGLMGTKPVVGASAASAIAEIEDEKKGERGEEFGRAERSGRGEADHGIVG